MSVNNDTSRPITGGLAVRNNAVQSLNSSLIGDLVQRDSIKMRGSVASSNNGANADTPNFKL